MIVGCMNFDFSPERVALCAKLALWWRVEFLKEHVNPRPGLWNYPGHGFDRMVFECAEAGSGILGLLCYSSRFDSSALLDWVGGDDLTHYPPRTWDSWERYVRNTVERYRSAITHWEVWNEPNNVQFWRPKPDAHLYRCFLLKTTAIIQEIQPDAVVMNGGLAGNLDNDAYEFGKDMLKPDPALGEVHIGPLNLHNYHFGSRSSHGLTIARQPRFVDLAEGRPIWVTETVAEHSVAAIDWMRKQGIAAAFTFYLDKMLDDKGQPNAELLKLSEMSKSR